MGTSVQWRCVGNAGERIVIPSSKLKLVLISMGALLFVASGIWLFAIADAQGRYAATYVKGVSVLGIVFFGVCGLYGLFKLLDRAPGLVLDREGIIDNSSALAAGRVAWREIRNIQAVTIKGQRFLALLVNDPEKYLDRGNVLVRLFVKMNHNMYGTPILIGSHSLAVKFDDLEKQMEDFRRAYGNA